MIQITIDGRQIEVPEGMTVLAAARRNGINIPTLCAQKELTPFGGCRLCIVELAGFRVPIASCTLPVSNGMVIRTQSEALNKSRKFILSMLFSERNHFCPYCQVSGGDCELQNAAYHEGITYWPMQPGWNEFPLDASHPYFVLDNNRCILCRRCVRACAELVGNFTLNMSERGAATLLVADANVPLGESSCINCGTCVQVCPTGALIDRASAYQGHDAVMTSVHSICAGCSVGCGINLSVHDNRIVRIEGDWQGAVNRGILCEHGRYDPINEKRTRLKVPMIKKNGRLKPVSWEEALEATAEHLKPLAGNATEGLAALASTRLPLEALAMFKELFADRLQSRMVTSFEEGATTAAVSAVAGRQGAFEGRLDLLKNADLVLCLGANIARSHMVAGFMVKRALPKGMRLVNINPEATELDELADLSLKPTPGSDLALIRGLQAVIVEEGLGRTALDLPDPAGLIEAAIRATGLSAAALRRAARMLANAISPVILFGKGISTQRDEKLVEALLDLARLTGAVDAERQGLLSVKGEANSSAAALLGLDQPFALEGQKAVFALVGDDFVSNRMIKLLRQAPFLVVQATFSSSLTDHADILLPAAGWAEEGGAFINMDGRLQQAAKALNPPAGVRENNAIISDLALRLKMPLQKTWESSLRERTTSFKLSEATPELEHKHG